MKNIQNQAAYQIHQKGWQQISDQVSEQVRNQVEQRLADQVSDQVEKRVTDQIYDQAGGRRGFFLFQISHQDWQRLNTAWDKGSEAYEQIWNEIYDQERKE